MKKITEQKFIGERALYQSQDLVLEYCTFGNGESPLKESKNISIESGLFQWKYPLWYCDTVSMKNSVMYDMARAGIWYSHHISLENVTIEAPKSIRRSGDIALVKVEMPNASETLWNCNKVEMKNVTAKGDYFAMGSSEMEIEGLTLVGILKI